MAVRTRAGMIAMVWLASLLAVGVWAQTPSQPDAKVLSGSDIGFRIERQERGTPVGKLVVRVNGQWVEAAFAAGISRVGTK